MSQKRIYEVNLERGDNWMACKYTIAATSEYQAIRRAKKQAAKDQGVKSGWRTVHLSESTCDWAE